MRLACYDSISLECWRENLYIYIYIYIYISSIVYIQEDRGGGEILWRSVRQRGITDPLGEILRDPFGRGGSLTP